MKFHYTLPLKFTWHFFLVQNYSNPLGPCCLTAGIHGINTGLNGALINLDPFHADNVAPDI